jgi:hypothetical protein
VGCGSQIAALTLIPYLFSLIFVIYRILSLETQEVGYSLEARRAEGNVWLVRSCGVDWRLAVVSFLVQVGLITK